MIVRLIRMIDHLNKEFGFDHVGTLREVGRKFGRMLDMLILQRVLN